MRILSSCSAALKSRSAASLAPLRPYKLIFVSQLPCMPVRQGSCKVLLVAMFLHSSAIHDAGIASICWTHLQALECGRQLVPILR